MEANGLDSTHSGLLSLPGHVEELLLSHLSRGEGGFQRLLNLRLVCSTTKGWVDDLPLQQGQRLFSECQAEVDLTEEGSLERFLENPPPSHVTALFLNGAGRHFDPKRESWNRFVQLWSPRLKSLQLDELSFPLNCRLSELVTSTSIRRLRCDEISCGGPADIPDFLFQLEELRVDLGCFGLPMDDSRRKATLRILCGVKSLVASYRWIESTCGLEFAADFLRIRKHNVESQLTFYFGTHSFMDADDVEFLQRFVSTVVASRTLTSIHVEDASEDFLRQVVFAVGQEDALQFFRCVESIVHFSGNVDEPLLLTNFPNLKRLECDGGDIRGPIEFPLSLESLTIQRGLPSRAILFPFLTSLELSKLECSAAELVRSLNFIGESCRRLENLEMDFVCNSQGDKEKKEEVGVPQENRLPFANLKTLTIRMKATRHVYFVGNARLVLLGGLALPRLSLTLLVVTFGGSEDAPRASLFDAGMLSSLIEGPIGKTLCDVDIEKGWVADGAEKLLTTLEGKATENRRKGQLGML